MKITILVFDWGFGPNGEEYGRYEVGKDDVVEIKENCPAGEGDRWFYDVVFKDGRKFRTFNPNGVTFERQDAGEEV